MRRRSTRWLLTALAGLLAMGGAHAAVIHVDGGVPASGDGTSWSQAYKTLPEALAAFTTGDEIWVARGTYAWADATGMVVANHTLLGGFTNGMATASARDAAAYPTILDGEGARRVFRKTAAGTFTLDGFTLRGGVGGTGGGGGLYVTAGALQVVDCVFTNNRSSAGQPGGAVSTSAAGMTNHFLRCTFADNADESTVYGGGAARLWGDATHRFEHCRFTGNTSALVVANSAGGGALLVGNGTTNTLLELVDCAFTDNQTAADGGALRVSTGRLLATRTDFAGNSAGRYGGAVYAPAAGVDNAFTHCAFVANAAGGAAPLGGGALMLWGNGARHTLAYCTFSANWAKGNGGALRVGNGTGTPLLSVANSILWGNRADGAGPALYHTQGTLTFAYTCLDTGQVVAASAPDYGPGMLAADPLFVSATAPHDVHLQSRYGRWNAATGTWGARDALQSPCIDAGDPAGDYALEPYRNGGRLNLGRYGNTPQASGSDVVLANDAVGGVGGATATLHGTWLGDGTAHAVEALWGPFDEGPAAWPHQGAVGVFAGTSNALTVAIGDLAPGALYYATLRATNAFADIWGLPTLSFRTDHAPGQAIVSNLPVAQLTDRAARLNGWLEADGGNATTVRVFWGTNYHAWAHTNTFGTVGAAPAAFATNVTGLTPNTRYYYQFYATNAVAATLAAPVETFSTHGPPVAANAMPAIGVGTATLKGSVVASNGAPTTLRMGWGATPGGTTPGSWANLVDLGVRAEGEIAEHTVGGLLYGVNYFFRTFATNAYGEGWAPAAPGFYTDKPAGMAIEGLPPTAVTDTAATLNGTLRAAGAVYTVWAQWWRSSGGVTNAAGLGVWSNATAAALSAPVAGLTASTSYGFRFLATNALDTLVSPSLTFKTPGPPAVDNAGGASGVSAVSATLNGTLTDGAAADVTIYWGPTDGGMNPAAWSNATPAAPASEGPFSRAVVPDPGTLHYYRCHASNAYGVAWAPASATFTTGWPRYVDRNATALPEDGSTWTNAYRTLTTALAAAPSGTGFWVAQGTYTEAGTLTVGTQALYGGFAGTETSLRQRDWEANPTTISGAQTRRLFNKSTAGVFTLDGFTLKDGKAVDSPGGAIYMSVGTGGLNIRNCVFMNNVATGETTGDGGAVSSYAGAGMENAFSNCVFVANRAEGGSAQIRGGGALYLNGSARLRLEDCRFEANTANNTVNSHGGAILLDSGAGQELRIADCTFTRNVARRCGGALFAAGGALRTVTNSVFVGNRAGGGLYSYHGGGALYLSGAAWLRVEDCRFEDNGATEDPNSNGGAILVDGGPQQEMWIAGSTFATNVATLSGGAVWAIGGAARTVSNCVFVSNRAEGENEYGYAGGGALYLHGSAWLRLADCRFTANTANYGSFNQGGAVLAGGDAGQDLRLSGCDFTGNASTHGGAIFTRIPTATNTFLNCAFVANQASYGGALRLWGNDARHTISNATIFRNSATDSGGAIRLGNDSGAPVLTIRNSIFWNNPVADGMEIHNEGGTLTLSYTSIDPSTISGAFVDGGGLIDGDPLFARETAPYDVHLKSRFGRWDPVLATWVFDGARSPCIDAGDPDSDYTLEPPANGGRINLGRYGNTAEASKGSGSPSGMMMLVR